MTFINWRSFLQYSISILITFGLLYYALRGIAFEEVLEKFQKADYTWIFVSAGLALLSHWSRAYRWKYLLEPLGYQLPIKTAFLAVMSGYFVNILVPRAGEVSRCGMVQRLNGIPMSTAFGTVVLERIIDLLMLFLLVLTVFLVEFNNLSDWFIALFSDKLKSLGELQYLIGFAFLTFMLAGGLVYYFWPRLKDRALVKKLRGIFMNIIKGVLSIRSVKNKSAFIGHTLFIWLMYYLMAYVLFFSLPATRHLDLWFGVLVLVMGAFGMGAPVNGGIGAYHLLVGKVFLLRGLSDKEGILMATFMHTAQTLTIILAGGLSLLIGMILMARVKKSQNSGKESISPLNHKNHLQNP